MSATIPGPTAPVSYTHLDVYKRQVLITATGSCRMWMHLTVTGINHQDVYKRQVIDIMIKHGWDGYLLSEYEGKNHNDINHCITQVRRHQLFMKKILGA